MKMKDVTAPYPSMAKANVLLFSNTSISISYSPVAISRLRLSDSRVMGLNNAVEKKKRLAKVIRRQADNPASMRPKSPNDGLVRISHRRTINPSDIINPIMRNRHWKCSGCMTEGLSMNESGFTSPLQYNSSL